MIVDCPFSAAARSRLSDARPNAFDNRTFALKQKERGGIAGRRLVVCAGLYGAVQSADGGRSMQCCIRARKKRVTGCPSEPVASVDLPEDALLLVDSPPIVYVLEGHPQFGPRFAPLFAAHAAGRLRFAVTTITVAEVLVGPLAGRRRRAGAAISRDPRLLAARSARPRHRRKRRQAAGHAPPRSGRCRAGRERIGDQRRRAGDARPRFFSPALAADHFLTRAEPPLATRRQRAAQ
jgi:hypothetical protein